MSDSIPALVARVQALEARVGDLEGWQTVEDIHTLHDVAIVLDKRDGETIEDAARKVVAQCNDLGQRFVEIGQILKCGLEETLPDAARRVVAERNAAVMERDEAVRMLHQSIYRTEGVYRIRPCESSVGLFRLLARHGLATDHGDGTFTLEEPKP